MIVNSVFKKTLNYSEVIDDNVRILLSLKQQYKEKAGHEFKNSDSSSSKDKKKYYNYCINIYFIKFIFFKLVQKQSLAQARKR
jgi:hypothetical protein